MTLDFDQVAPFPEVQPDNEMYAAALRFKPQLHISNGCHPYPAVNKHGDTSDGLSVWRIFTTCKGSPLGSQIYGRMVEQGGHFVILYALFFPRDRMVSLPWFGHHSGWEHLFVRLSDFTSNAELLSVTVKTQIGYTTYGPHEAQYMDGDHFKVKYTWLVHSQHFLKATTKPGEFQDLIMWSNMTKEAQDALEHTKFFGSKSPLSTKKFHRLVAKALKH
ncbi:unnamed protein product [Peronospora belbahrii]|nr:unnamed protein product [Peronospora belbahrii]CAH0513803.1 unnamed protein product [Peronospora belbahrii]